MADLTEEAPLVLIVDVHGVSMPDQYLKIKDEIIDFEVNEDDVWICSFPKSGTTWTQEMVWMIVNNLDYEGAKTFLELRSPFLEFTSILYTNIEDEDYNRPFFEKDSLGFVKTLPSPVCIKTHLPWKLLPRQIQDGVKKPKIIYVARNPKDVCTSSYYHRKLFLRYAGDFNIYSNLFLEGKVPYSPYWGHVLPFWERRHEPHILFITYEGMKKDLPKVVAKVSEFLERPLTESQIDILCKHLSFESMRDNIAVNKQALLERYKMYKIAKGDGRFIRSGIVGDYKNNMSAEMIKTFDKWIHKNLEDTDYKLPL